MKKLLKLVLGTGLILTIACQKKNVQPTTTTVIDTVYKTQVKNDTVHKTDTVIVVKTDTVKKIDSILYNPTQTLQGKEWILWKQIQYQNNIQVLFDTTSTSVLFTSDSLISYPLGGGVELGSVYITYGNSTVTLEYNPADPAGYEIYIITSDPTTGGYILTRNYMFGTTPVENIWYLK